MKKYVWINNADEVVMTLKSGKKLQCVMSYDAEKRMIVIKPNNAPKVKVRKEELLGHTDFGRVTRNSRFVNIIQHYPVEMGAKRMVKAIGREATDVKDIIETNEIIETL
jgi:hypothetical protein